MTDMNESKRSGGEHLVDDKENTLPRRNSIAKQLGKFQLAASN